MACDYTQCVIKSESCGPHNRSKRSGCFIISDLSHPAKQHLVNLGLLRAHMEDKDNFTERNLIENRLGKVLKHSDVICAHHRFVLGYSWKPPKICQHPEHKSQPIQKKGPAVRLATIQLCKIISKQYGILFPIGGVLCKTHLNELYAGSISTDNTATVDEDSSDSYHPPKTLELTELDISASTEMFEKLSNSLDMTPLKFRLKKTSVNELADTSKQYLKRKYNKAKASLKKKFCEAVAPGQDAELMDMLSSEESANEEQGNIPEDLQDLLQVYECSDALAKIALLSLVNPEKYSKEYLMEVFRCSKYKIDIARRWRAKGDGLELPIKQPHGRLRLDLGKCEHFLDFVFTNGLMQDVAYGVTTLKFDSGLKQTIPHCILTAKFSHVITIYKQHCENVGYELVSESTLWKILRALKPSQRKCLAGLDNTTADGLNGFLTLESIVKEQAFDKELIIKLEKGKRYLKTRYASHCLKSSNVATHCISLALSDPKNKKLASNECTADHTDVCMECFNLLNTLQSIMDLIFKIPEKSLKDEKIYDGDLAKNQILTWMKHIMRDAQQSKAKVKCVSNLDNGTAFWLKDYCQKVLPLKFREGQQDYFGKKGITLHVDVFFLKPDLELEKKVYFTVIFRSDQSMEDTLCIGQNVLNEFKKDHPNITKVYSKSDNAGSYHGNYFAEASSRLCEEVGIKLLRIDYNEPQKGKDQCDRESATARNLMRAYVDSGNDLLSADDVFEALQFSGGIRNGKVCVAEIDKEKVALIGSKIPNISNYHSFEFERNRMKLWRYFDIGEGETLPFSGVEFTSGLILLKPFKETSGARKDAQKQKVRKDRKWCSLHFCNEVNCSETYDTIEELEAHILSGVHSEIQAKTSMDKVRQSFSARMQVSSLVHVPMSSSIKIIDVETSSDIIDFPFYEPFMKIGWALPVRSNFRFNVRQKQFLLELFMTGETTSKKCSPNQVVNMMRSAVKDGKKLFTQSEYCTSTQIQSLFSRWTQQTKKGNSILPVECEEDIELGETSREDPDDTSYAQDLQAEIYDQLQHLSDDITIGSWVVVLYNETWYPGEVLDVKDDQTKVKCMEKAGISQFKWPKGDDVMWYTIDDVLCHIDPPVPVSTRAFGLTSADMNKITSLVKK